MSKFYAESNNESTIELFNKRQVYKRLLPTSRSRGHRNIKDFNHGEMCYYGKLDNYFSPIYVPPNSSYIKKIPLQDQQESYECFNFVADLFNEMNLEFRRCVATGKIKKDDPYLSTLKVYKAFNRPTESYEQYIQIFKSKILKLFRSKNIQVENFSHFLQEFMNVYPHIVKTVPFTFTSYIKSKYNDVMTSGLAIEIADLSYDNDDEKQKLFIESPNWKFFVNACNKYGFLIDYNLPWRIICDIKTPEIQTYINSAGLVSGHVLLNDGVNGFAKASFKTLGMLPRHLLDIYNHVKKKSFIKNKICNGRKMTEVVIPESYTIEELYSYLSAPESLVFPKMYILMRLHEENLQITQEQKRLIVKDVIDNIVLEDSYSPIESLFERFLNKPFDKPFTMDYYYSIVRPAKNERRFTRGEISAMMVDEQTNLNNY